MIIQVGGLTFDFPATWSVTQYDDWPFYRNQFQACCNGNKAVDLLALDPSDGTLWLVEVKDYRQHPRSKPLTPWDEMAQKARDTLAGLVAAQFNSAPPESAHAHAAVRARKLHIVLHLEQPAKASKLFPRVFDLADVQQKLRQLIKPLDPHPLVVDMDRLGSVAWTVRSGAQR